MKLSVRWLAPFAATATVIALSFAAGSPGNASDVTRTKPLVEINGNYNFQNVQDALWIHAHADNAPIADSNDTLQSWDIVNPKNVNGTTYAQVKLHGADGSWCFTYDTATGVDWLRVCSTTNLYQYWTIPGVQNRSQFLPYEDTSLYLTDGGAFGDSTHTLDLSGPNNGNWAVWGWVCNNC